MSEEFLIVTAMFAGAGAVVGIVVGMLTKRGTGFIGNAIIGAIGAVIGLFVFDIIPGTEVIPLSEGNRRWLVAGLCAALLVLIAGLTARRR